MDTAHDLPRPIGEPSGRAADDPADVLAEVAALLSSGRVDEAAALLAARCPMRRDVRVRHARARSARREDVVSPLPPTTPARRLALFVRDGFVDRRTGRRLVYPAALHAIAHALPDALPIGDAGAGEHPAHRELLPTLAHVDTGVRARSAGSMHAELCWATVSAAAGAGGPLDADPERAVADPGWDGLLGWYVDHARTRPHLADLPGNRGWHAAALSAPRPPAPPCAGRP